jgi:hypothetical protein
MDLLVPLGGVFYKAGPVTVYMQALVLYVGIDL